MRYLLGLLGSCIILTLVACEDASGPDPSVDEGSVAFAIDEGADDFSATGDFAVDQGIPSSDEWAVAADPDSLGGIVVMAFQPTAAAGDQGSLFLLQLHPVRTGAFDPCGPNADCHARLFLGWRVDLGGYSEWFEVVSGAVQVDELTDTRIRGSFAFALRNEGGTGTETLTIDAGEFDVPIDDGVGGFICGIPPSQGCLTGAI